MHWARVIRETDNPEWTAVLHKDGGISEVSVGVTDDEVHVHLSSAQDRTIFVHGDFTHGDRRGFGNGA
jgi:hypothetical protein